MKTIIRKSPLACAVGLLALAGVAPTAFANSDMEQRIQMLEQQLQMLKTQMQEEKQAAAAKPAAATSEKPSVAVASGSNLTFGGYLKADYRYVDGELGYQDYWRGNNPGAVDTQHTGFNVKESRFNMTYAKGDMKAFVEMDFYGGEGNEIATNSTNPRLRHAFVSYQNWLVGQYWSTFTPLKAFPDALDFAGPIVGEVFVRQPQIRYTNGNFSVALENPETWGDGDVGNNGVGGGQGAAGADPDETNPDLVAAYRFTGDWGEVQVGTLLRRVDEGGVDETAFAANLGGMLKVGEQDDLRFQLNYGESGRYIGAGMTPDIVLDPTSGQLELEETTAYYLAYRHVWNSDWRSTLYYGNAQTDVTEIDRTHWGLNLIRQLTSDLSVGVELGNYAVDDEGGTDADSDYLQMSWKYTL